MPQNRCGKDPTTQLLCSYLGTWNIWLLEVIQHFLLVLAYPSYYLSFRISISPERNKPQKLKASLYEKYILNLVYKNIIHAFPHTLLSLQSMFVFVTSIHCPLFFKLLTSHFLRILMSSIHAFQRSFLQC